MVRSTTPRGLQRAVGFLLAASIAATTLVSHAAAQDGMPKGAVRQACSADVRTVCAGVMPGGGRLKQCMIDKVDQLSSGCKAALKQVRAQSTGK